MSVELDIVRAVFIDGARVEPGQRITVGSGLAAELISSGKARKALPALPPAAPERSPVEPEPRPARRRLRVTETGTQQTDDSET